MTSLFDNELVLKYFGDIQEWKTGEPVKGIKSHGCSAQKILRAMQEPIKKGDRILFWHQMGMQEATASYAIGEYHPINLRLPARFQAQLAKECK